MNHVSKLRIFSLGICTVFLVNSRVYADQYTPMTLNWNGQWNCNLDGRSATIEFWRERIPDECANGICRRTFGTIFRGRVSDNGGKWVALEMRSPNQNDPPNSNSPHVLPLRYNNTDDWLLMVHTWDYNFASGYTTWQGRPYGLQCRKK
jgi:hypothetical protein